MPESPVTTSGRDRAATAILGLVAALVTGGGIAYLVWPEADCRHVAGGYLRDAGLPPNTCWLGTVEGPSQAWETFGLCPGQSGLAVAKICFYEDPRCLPAEASDFQNDAGEELMADPDAGVTLRSICAPGAQLLPNGIRYTPADEAMRDYVPGEPEFEVWEATHPDAPWRCACGATVEADVDAGACEVQSEDGTWRPGKPEDERKPGHWRGACARHPCGDWSGGAYQPAACCQGACDNKECGTNRCGQICGTCQPSPDDLAAGKCYGFPQCLGHKCVQQLIPCPGPDAAEELPDAGQGASDAQ